MVHDSAQQTLDPHPGRQASLLAASLGLIPVAAWLAFERSTHIRAPVATSLRLAFQLFRLLEGYGVYQFAIENRGPGVRRAIYDPLSWVDAFERADSEDLEELLLQRLRVLVASAETCFEKPLLWTTLADAEVEGYLSAQLRKHGFDGSWAERIVVSLRPEWDGISLAKRRYLVWAGVRQGAAAYLQSGGNNDSAFVAILTELRRRGRWLAANEKQGQQLGNDFLPFASWTRPLVLEIFLSEIWPMGADYWTQVPKAGSWAS